MCFIFCFMRISLRKDFRKSKSKGVQTNDNSLVTIDKDPADQKFEKCRQQTKRRNLAVIRRGFLEVNIKIRIIFLKQPNE